MAGTAQFMFTLGHSPYFLLWCYITSFFEGDEK